jgi:hypothetical protein
MLCAYAVTVFRASIEVPSVRNIYTLNSLKWCGREGVAIGGNDAICELSNIVF